MPLTFTFFAARLLDALSWIGCNLLCLTCSVTEANPGGEIRGQILPHDYALILFELSPEQEVPRVESQANGLGYATLNTDTASAAIFTPALRV